MTIYKDPSDNTASPPVVSGGLTGHPGHLEQLNAHLTYDDNNLGVLPHQRHDLPLASGPVVRIGGPIGAYAHAEVLGGTPPIVIPPPPPPAATMFITSLEAGLNQFYRTPTWQPVGAFSVRIRFIATSFAARQTLTSGPEYTTDTIIIDQDSSAIRLFAYVGSSVTGFLTVPNPADDKIHELTLTWSGGFATLSIDTGTSIFQAFPLNGNQRLGVLGTRLTSDRPFNGIIEEAEFLDGVDDRLYKFNNDLEESLIVENLAQPIGAGIDLAAITLAAGWTDNGDGTYTADGTQSSGINISTNQTVTAEVTYITVLEVISRAAGSVKLIIGGVSTPSYVAVGVMEAMVIAANGNAAKVNGSGAFAGTVRITTELLREAKGTAIAVNVASSSEYQQVTAFQWKTVDNYWSFGDISLDGSDAAFDTVAGSTAQGITRGEASLNITWGGNTLSGNCRFVAGVATRNVGANEEPVEGELVDSGGNERLYFQTREAGVTGGLQDIEVRSIVNTYDTRTLHTVVHFGDSITNYMLDQAIPEYEALYSDTYDKRVVAVNEGVGGNTIQDMAARLPALLATYAGQSNIVFIIMAGTNQLVPENLAAYSAVLTQIVSDIGNAGFAVAIANKTASANDDQAGTEPLVNTGHNNPLCSSETSAWFTGGRPLLDLYTLTAGHHSAPTWFQDNVHPNELGRAEMREYFAEHIASKLDFI